MAPSATYPEALTVASTKPKITQHATGITGKNPLDASKLTYSLTSSPRAVPEEGAKTGTETICTDHMVLVNWTDADGWTAPAIKPYGPLSLMPTASCLHYATECFEGLKAYRGYDGKLRLFRPDHNVARMRISASRISLPLFDPAELQRLIVALLSVDADRWLPQDSAGSCLYIRPTLIGTQPQLGLQAPKEATLYVVISAKLPMDMPSSGMRLCTSPDDMIRSWAGGFGYAKVGANYGPSIVATQDAHRQGYHQVLWLYGEGECTEAGASNFFVVWKRKDGRKELITAPLDDHVILNGVTRRSCLELARKRLGNEMDVVERKYTIAEIIDAEAEGRIFECFAAGTAYFICPVSKIHHRGQDIKIPMGSDGVSGDVTRKLKNWLDDIMYGRVDNDWAVTISENE